MLCLITPVRLRSSCVCVRACTQPPMWCCASQSVCARVHVYIYVFLYVCLCACEYHQSLRSTFQCQFRFASFFLALHVGFGSSHPCVCVGVCFSECLVFLAEGVYAHGLLCLRAHRCWREYQPLRCDVPCAVLSLCHSHVACGAQSYMCARAHEQDVPVLLSVPQKGAYWRRTCFVLLDDPTDEDSRTRNLSCARFALQ